MLGAETNKDPAVHIQKITISKTASMMASVT